MARLLGRRSFGPCTSVRYVYSVVFPNQKNLAASCAWRDFVSSAFLALVVIGFTSSPVLAQTPASVDDVHINPRIQPEKPTETIVDPSLKTHTAPIKKEVSLVLVPVTITDPMNRLVTGLDKENFQLFEGKDAQEIKHFSNEDAPVSLGVIFDMSGSMSSKIERAREAVVEFFKTANPQDEFFMITFADQPEEISDFTQSVEDIQGKLVYTVPKGRTALLDAIYLGVSKMRQAKYPKKALLIISDGGDNHSRYTGRRNQVAGQRSGCNDLRYWPL